MSLELVREVSLTLAAVGAGIGGTAGSAALSWRVIRWMGARIEREKAITAVLAQFPVMVERMTEMGETLKTISKGATSNERAAVAERSLQAEDRATRPARRRAGATA